MKTACIFCGGHLEHEETLGGIEIPCPHCNQRIVLPTTGIPPTQEPPDQAVSGRVRTHGWRRAIVGAAVAVAALVAVTSFVFRDKLRAWRAGVPFDVTLSDIQLKDLRNGYLFTPDDIQAIRAGRTAGFYVPPISDAQKAANRAITITGFQVDFARTLRDAYVNLVVANLRVQLANVGAVPGSGWVFLFGYDTAGTMIFDDAFQYTAIPPGTAEPSPVKVWVEADVWASISQWRTKWHPEDAEWPELPSDGD